MCSPPLHSITQISGEALALPDSAPDALESSLSATMQPGPSETQFTDPWMLMPSSESKLSAHRVTPESSQDESVWSSTQPDPFTSRTELDSSIPKFEQLSDLPSQEVHGAIPKTKFECRTIMTDGIQPVCANHGCEGGSHDSSSSSLLTPPDPFRVTTSCEPMKTSSSVLQNTMKNLRTLSPRSSPRHTASERKELPNCYAQEEDGLDLPPPHTPLVPVGNCGEKPAVPPKPPPRGPYMKRSKTVDVACDMGKPLLSHADRKIKWGGNKANTVATDRDFAERSQLKSASFDKCIIDTEDNFLLSTPRCIRGILEMQGHSFETPDDFVDQEPDYPPPPVPLEEPTVMTEKHIPFRVPLLPEPPEPMSPEDRAFVLKTLERQNSVPLSLAFEDDFARERRLSCGSNSSSATYISPRSSSIAPKTIQVPPALNGVPTPIKRVPLVTDERYNVPRKIPEADLLRYNISQTTQNTVSFTPVGDPRQSVMSDIVRELDYEIVVFERSARKNGTPPDQAYEAMKFNQSSSGPGTIYSSMSLQTAANGTFIQQRSESGYVNASRPTASRTADCGTSPTEEGESSGRMQGPSTIEPTGSASTGANQGYAVMSLGRPKVGKRDVRRARSVDNLLGSTDECLSTSSRHDNLPEQTTFAASDIPTRPLAPPPAHGHVFEKSAPGYIRMKGSTKQRSSSVCLLSKPAEH